MAESPVSALSLPTNIHDWIYQLITCADPSPQLKQITKVRNIVGKIKERRAYETDFKTETRKPTNFRCASRHRYGQVKGLDAKELSLDSRYSNVPFPVFCFAAPAFTPEEVASIHDLLWPHVVSFIATHIKKIPIPNLFFEKAEERLVTLKKEGILDKFENERALLDAEFKAQVEETIQSGTTILEKAEDILQLSTEFKEKLEGVATVDCAFRRSSSAPEHHTPQPSPSPLSTECIKQPNLPQAEASQQEAPRQPPPPPSSPPTHDDNRHPSEPLAQRYNPQYDGRNALPEIYNAQPPRNPNGENPNDENPHPRKRTRHDEEQQAYLPTQSSLPTQPFPAPAQTHVAPQILQEARGTQREAEGATLTRSWLNDGRQSHGAMLGGLPTLQFGQNKLQQHPRYTPLGVQRIQTPQEGISFFTLPPVNGKQHHQQQPSQNQYQSQRLGYEYNMMGDLDPFLPQQQGSQNQSQGAGYGETCYSMMGDLDSYLPQRQGSQNQSQGAGYNWC